ADGAVVGDLRRWLLVRAARWFQHRLLPAVVDRYERLLRTALERRLLVLGGSAVAFVVTIIAFGVLNAGVEFFPEGIPPQTVWAEIDAPDGTSPAFLDQLTQRVEIGRASCRETVKIEKE